MIVDICLTRFRFSYLLNQSHLTYSITIFYIILMQAINKAFTQLFLISQLLLYYLTFVYNYYPASLVVYNNNYRRNTVHSRSQDRLSLPVTDRSSYLLQALRAYSSADKHRNHSVEILLNRFVYIIPFKLGLL